MRILLVSTRLPHRVDDGIVIPVAELLRGLSRRHEVVLAGFERPGTHADQAAAALSGVAREVVVLPRRADVRRFLPLAWAQIALGLPLSVTPYAGTAARRAVARVLADGGIDAVLCHLVHTAAVVPSIATRALPSCMIIQDAVYSQIEQNLRYARGPLRRAYGRLDVRLMRRYEAEQYRRFARCCVVSGAERERVRVLGRDIRVDVLANGVDADAYGPASTDRDGRALVYVGSLAGERNEEAAWILATEVFPALRARMADVTLAIVGKSASRRLRALAAGVEVCSDVEDVRPFLRRAALFLMPQVVGTGIKNSVLQAMAAELAVVAFPAAVQGIEGEPGRDYLVCHSTAEMMDAALALLRDPGRARAIGASGRRLVQRSYTWERYVTGIETLLEGAVADRGSVAMRRAG